MRTIPSIDEEEPTGSSSESTVGEYHPEGLVELALGMGLVVAGISTLSYFVIKKRGI